MQIVDAQTRRTHELIDRYAAPYFRPRPRVFLRGRGDGREAVGYANIEGTVLTARTPVRPIIERLTNNDPQLRRDALALAGCSMGGDELGWNPFKAVADAASDAANWVVDTADKVAEKVTGKKLVSMALDIGKKVVQVAKDVAYSPYFQAALVALPIPGTAAVAAGIRAVQTIEALAKAAAKGRFDAKAALGLAKAGLAVKNAQTPEQKTRASDLLRKAQEEAKKLGISPEAAKKALNVAQNAAKSVIKSKGMVEQLVKAPNAIQKILQKAKQATDPAKKEALTNLAKALEQRKKQGPKANAARAPTVTRKAGKAKNPFVRHKLMRTQRGHIVPAEKFRRDLVDKQYMPFNRYKQLKSPSVQNYRNVMMLRKRNAELDKAQRELQRLKKLQKTTNENWMRARKELQKLKEATRSSDPKAAKKMVPRLLQALDYLQQNPAKRPMAEGGLKSFQQYAGIPETGAYDGKTRGVLIHFGADNPPPTWDGSRTVAYQKPGTGTIQRPAALEQAARKQGKQLFMVQAPSLKVYPVAV